MKNNKKIIIPLIGVFVFYVSIVLFADFRTIFMIIQQVNYSYYSIIIGLVILGLVINGIRFHIILKCIDVKTKFHGNAAIATTQPM